jgi:hypothetical protein
MTDEELKAAYKQELAALLKKIKDDHQRFQVSLHRRNRITCAVLIAFASVLVVWCFFMGLYAPQAWAKALNAINVTVNLWAIRCNLKSWNRYKPL